ncbi:MAG: hypothetical protein E7384_01965 [Ruminococcaceae bacterium]|nr:hypothetical protein [Oscillospiraceae bacterium]
MKSKILSTWGNVAALGHIASDIRSNSTDHFKVCTRCYEQISGSKASHSGGKATCLTQAKCSACNVSYGKLAAHSLATDVWGFIDAAGHAHLCTVQGCPHRGDVIPHKSSGPATDDTDEVCIDCGYVITLALNHTHTAIEGYQYDNESHWQICGCLEIMDKENHVDSDGDNKCDVCGYLPEDGEIGDNADNNGNNANPSKDKGKNKGKGNKSYVIWIVVASVIVVLGAGGGVTYFIIKKKKKV